MSSIRLSTAIAGIIIIKKEKSEKEGITKGGITLNKYMVAFVFTQGTVEERLALVPAELAKVKELQEQGIMESVILSNDRSKGWVIVYGESQDDVQAVFESLPFYKFMSIEITPLADLSES